MALAKGLRPPPTIPPPRLPRQQQRALHRNHFLARHIRPSVGIVCMRLTVRIRESAVVRPASRARATRAIRPSAPGTGNIRNGVGIVCMRLTVRIRPSAPPRPPPSQLDVPLRPGTCSACRDPVLLSPVEVALYRPASRAGATRATPVSPRLIRV